MRNLSIILSRLLLPKGSLFSMNPDRNEKDQEWKPSRNHLSSDDIESGVEVTSRFARVHLSFLSMCECPKQILFIREKCFDP